MSIEELYPIGTIISSKNNEICMVVGYSKNKKTLKIKGYWGPLTYVRPTYRYVYKEEFLDYCYRDRIEAFADENNITITFKAVLV